MTPATANWTDLSTVLWYVFISLDKTSRLSTTRNKFRRGESFRLHTLNEINYRIFRPIRRTFFLEKCDLNSTCVLCAEGKHYFQTYKYPYIYYTALSWDSEICFQIMRYGITACERLTFLFGDLPQRIHCITCDSGYLRCCSSNV